MNALRFGFVARAVRLALVGAFVLFGAPTAGRLDAQAARTSREPITGLQLAVLGGEAMTAGEVGRVRGTAFDVRGLATLEPKALATLRARWWYPDASDAASDWTLGTANADGSFVLAVAAPDEPGAWQLELEVYDATRARSFMVPMPVEPALVLDLRTDRRRYQPAETMHVWLAARRRSSGRPAEDVDIDVELAGVLRERVHAHTGVDGVVSFERTLPADERGDVVVVARASGSSATTRARVEQRDTLRMEVMAGIEPAVLSPERPGQLHVAVRTIAGSPIVGAEVIVERATHAIGAGVTGDDGGATIALEAPSFASGVESQTLLVRVAHEVYGASSTVIRAPIAESDSLTIEAVARAGYLVPEIADIVILGLRSPSGAHAPAGTEIDVRGPAVVGGRAVVRVDENGLAELPVRAARGTWTPDGDGYATTLFVSVRGELEQYARLEVPVVPEADVLPRITVPITAPGTTLDVEIARAPTALLAPVTVELRQNGELLEAVLAGPRASRVTLHVPAERVGVLAVRVRRRDGRDRAELDATYDHVLVRPTAPRPASITTDRPAYFLGERPRVTVQAGALPSDTRAFAAVLIRDLAAHAGEVPFTATFLDGAFEPRLLEAQSPADERLLRAAMARWQQYEPRGPIEPPLVDDLGLAVEPNDTPDFEIDPYPLARQLERRGVAPMMQRAQEILREALDRGALSEVTSGTGSQRTLRSDLLADDASLRTLGDEPVAIEYLEHADPSFRYETIARLEARRRWLRLADALARYLDPGDDAPIADRAAVREPWERWVPRMVERGIVSAEDLDDPWGGRFRLTVSAHPRFVLAAEAAGLELVSPGPDGRVGTGDDFRDPTVRAVEAGTPFAVASSEDDFQRALALLSPVAATLTAIEEAYRRVALEIREEEIGDAVHADVSDGLFRSSFGASGTGSGYGAGYGAGRSSRSPAIRAGEAHAAFDALATALRHRFPPTLRFVPSIELSANGEATFELELADAVTSYVVEAIVWRTDGWRTSASTTFQARREVSMDPSVPTLVGIGDVVEVPVRVQNDGDGPRRVRARIDADSTLGLERSESTFVEVPAHSARRVSVALAPARSGRSQLRILLIDADGATIDAIGHDVEVLERRRMVRRTWRSFGIGSAAIATTTPADARAHAATLRVTLDAEVFAAPSSTSLRDRVRVLAGGTPDDEHELPGEARAFRLGVERWLATRETAPSDSADATMRTQAISWLWSVATWSTARPERASRLAASREALRRIVETAATLPADVDALELTRAAAVLAWTSESPARDAVARELVRRAERSVVVVGDEIFVASAADPVAATLAFLATEARAGEVTRAVRMLTTIARWTDFGRALDDEERALTQLALAAISSQVTTPARLVLVRDGAPTELDRDALGRLESEQLSAPGEHRVTMTAGAHQPIGIEATITYGVPWPAAPVRGPLELEVRGEPGTTTQVGTLELVVRNRSPRLLAHPIVEVEVPAGATVDTAHRASACSTCRSSTLVDGTWRIELAPFTPGQERVIALPLRWESSGSIGGLGVAAFTAEHPEAASVLPPRSFVIASPGVAP